MLQGVGPMLTPDNIPEIYRTAEGVIDTGRYVAISHAERSEARRTAIKAVWKTGLRFFSGRHSKFANARLT